MLKNVDLTKYAFKRVRGDITIIGSWWMKDDQTPPEPCLILYRTFDTDLLPYLIPLQNLWHFVEKVGNPRVAARSCHEACAVLGLDQNNPRDVFRVMDLIQDNLEELATMPPMPEVDRQLAAEIVVTDLNSGKTNEAAIYERKL